MRVKVPGKSVPAARLAATTNASGVSAAGWASDVEMPKTARSASAAAPERIVMAVSPSFFLAIGGHFVQIIS